MGISKSTYYFELSKVDAVALRNEDLMNKILSVFASA